MRGAVFIAGADGAVLVAAQRREHTAKDRSLGPTAAGTGRAGRRPPPWNLQIRTSCGADEWE